MIAPRLLRFSLRPLSERPTPAESVFTPGVDPSRMLLFRRMFALFYARCKLREVLCPTSPSPTVLSRLACCDALFNLWLARRLAPRLFNLLARFVVAIATDYPSVRRPDERELAALPKLPVRRRPMMSLSYTWRSALRLCRAALPSVYDRASALYICGLSSCPLGWRTGDA